MLDLINLPASYLLSGLYALLGIILLSLIFLVKNRKGMIYIAIIFSIICALYGGFTADTTPIYFLMFFTIIFVLVMLTSDLQENNYSLKSNEDIVISFFILLGVILMVTFQDFLVFIVGLEISSLSGYMLLAIRRLEAKSSEAALRYFLMGIISSAFIIFGFSLMAIYVAMYADPSYSLVDITNYARFNIDKDVLNAPLYYIGFLILSIGILLKIGIPPFGLWLSGVYYRSDSSSLSYIFTIPKLAILVAYTYIFVFTIPANSSLFITADLTIIFSMIIIFGLVVSSLGAFGRHSLKKFFAFSGMYSASFILMLVMLKSLLPIYSIVFYMFVYSLSMVGIFTVISILNVQGIKSNKEDLNGLFYRSKFLSIVFAVCLLSLGGIPGTAGFIAKFVVLFHVFEVNNIWFQGMFMVAIATSIIAVFYYLDLIRRIFFIKESSDKVQIKYDKKMYGSGAKSALIFIMATLIVGGFYPELINMLLGHS